ncbi:MAG: dihydrofolate reductase [Acidobacteriota bacterium]
MSRRRPTLALVAAVASNGVIGRDGDLPWHLPDDLRFFKRLTRGHAVIMGRTTFASILDRLGRPLPGRASVVLSRAPASASADLAARVGVAQWDPLQVRFAGDLDAAIDLAQAMAGASDLASDPLFIIGGAEVYRAAMPRIDVLHLTEIDAAIDGDVHLPLPLPPDPARWQLATAEDHPIDDRHAHAFRIARYVRRDVSAADEADAAGEPAATDDPSEAVLRCGALAPDALDGLWSRYGLRVAWVDDDAPIPGSYWGPPEAGVVDGALHVRRDTPVHSALHEGAHWVCAPPARRAAMDTEAGGGDDEENAVCYLEIVLAAHLPGAGRARLLDDMDRWGYSFRLGSARAWFEAGGEGARAWLEARALIDASGAPTFRARSRAD